ncbi:Carboxypeptidase regulatory-like domain-containing protein [Sinosporangium album]|uniref:alpha-amylase n=1 Tax=Sinosporangium album TaxID=504805 RepID=A0A1G7W0J8_9ACTN|nr:carboxypeptidase regulatory-like domain-containing protein [Sinosporangium album]SDG65554.1 Carboxypeptidase regulatory-like domain-containing protein [Sinosporangium album]
MPRTPRRWRTILLGTVTAFTLLIPQGVASAAPAAAPAAPGNDKIDRSLLAELKAAEKAVAKADSKADSKADTKPNAKAGGSPGRTADGRMADGRTADGKTGFLVRLKGGADLNAARAATTRADKGAQVYKAKTAFAASSQAGLRTLLAARKARFTPLWIVNAVHVTGDAALAAEIAALPEVERIEPDIVLANGPVNAPGKSPGKSPGNSAAGVEPDGPKGESPARAQAAAAVAWNIERIGASQVWSEFKTRGEGIVVGNIGSGVQFDHPALAAQYRGKRADGGVDHNYNWFDAMGTCEGAPCDVCTISPSCNGYGFGTPQMSLMVGGSVGDDIGVAPEAKWITARGCDGGYCYFSSLLAAGQWMLAPTDLTGGNPRPDLAPDVITNSWGTPGDRSGGVPGYHRWYKEIVDAWVAAGIFPALNNGPRSQACNSSFSPGQYANGYSVGTFDANNAINAGSGRGPGENGEIKPNIAAPGVNVRTAIAGNGYRTWTDQSFSAAHVAGAVALMWSAVPSLYRDVPATRALLDRTAVDVDDTSCGGTPAKNNVWGEGRLDVYAALKAAPAEAAGGLTGTVTAGGSPVALASVTVAGAGSRTVVTASDGGFRIPRLAAGARQVTVRKAGYGEAVATVTVTAGQTAVHDVTLAPSAARTVSGTVTLDGVPEAGATVRVSGAPDSAVTGADGRYSLPLPEGGGHEVKVTSPAPSCGGATTAAITAPATTAPATTGPVAAAPAAGAGDVVKDIAMQRRTDFFGYSCVKGAHPYAAGTEKLATQPDTPISVTLPFAFPFYNGTYTKASISPVGFVNFFSAVDPRSRAFNWRLPTTNINDAAIFPFWDDVVVDDQAGIYTATTGFIPDRTYVIEWRNVTFKSDPTKRVSFAALLGENGSIGFRYRGAADGPAGGLTGGASATVGLEGTKADNDAFLYSFNKPVLAEGRSLTFAPTRHGLVRGTVTDANDGRPLAGATVKIGDVAETTTGEDGTYVAYAPPGEHRITASKTDYGTVGRQVIVGLGTRMATDIGLVTGRVSADTTAVELVAPGGANRSATVTLTNLGTAATAYTVESDAAQSWLTASPRSGELAPGASVTVTVHGSGAGLAPGSFRAGELVVRSASAGNPRLSIPVTVVVPQHQIALDVGGTKDITDAAGDRWTADRAYTPGGHGYMGAETTTHTFEGPIQGTTDQELFKTAREAMLEYRFDKVPNGVYTIELGFADTRDTRPGQRVFAVTAEGRLVVPVLDLAQSVGAHTATTRRYTVKVTDGQLNLRFVGQRGSPLVNAVRITERPDKTAAP